MAWKETARHSKKHPKMVRNGKKQQETARNHNKGKRRKESAAEK